MATRVYPRRNLPGTAGIWGRHVELRLHGVETQAQAYASEQGVNLRATAGGLDVNTIRVQEIAARGSSFLDIPDITTSVSVAANEIGSPTIPESPVGPISQVIEVPSPDGAMREYVAVISFVIANSSTDGLTNYYAAVQAGTDRVRGAAPYTLSAPSGWGQSRTLVVSGVTNGSAAEIPFIVAGIVENLRTSPSTVTVGLSGIRVFIQFGAKV